MMTESYTETIGGNVASPYGYRVLTAELALSHFDSASAHDSGTVVSDLPSAGETVTVADVEGFCPRLLRSNVDSAAMSAGIASGSRSGNSGFVGAAHVAELAGMEVVVIPDDAGRSIAAGREFDEFLGAT